MSTTGEPLSSCGDTWLAAAQGERQAIRVDSRTTGGAYAIIESAAQPGCAVPTHLHRNEDEHFLVISGRYRIAVGSELFDAPPGARVTVPRNSPHSWRNIAQAESRLLAILIPGGFEQIAYQVARTPADQIRELAARYGCDILGPPVA
ncbi:cupin domain-containing protein [Mycobacterium montefiorense]|uniref:Cupin n=1 Tax=Mycobacterium montefiorense TaxID=154654 RepID=A0AA37PIB9_9MYCO|nr:cupin domain-containing protein [Mycobacterium montefiorense]GBG37408.1 cupin [Mycobacterium montefiorense]GKU36645.1 cupin [Mycobacterium montefiorense]GKU42170.1 cupin [Mycobacterium montefiorense]GKU45903.1 cupin [Mycobacterium montefiorense]GKU52905.1 cupin [Mycobacterium montefiorense]